MAADDDLPWTTSRCNRLLRPLSSKLAKLRKELDSHRSAISEAQKHSSAHATKFSPRKAASFVQPARKPRGLDKARDPDWVPGAKPAGANKKTYGRGGRKQAIQRTSLDGNAARPGEIAFTPLIARTSGMLQESPRLQSSPLRKYPRNRGPLLAKAEQIQNLKNQMPSDIGMLVKGSLEAYAYLLQATAEGEGKRWTGSRSLMATCLRKIPAYIELEEYFAELDHGEGDNVVRDMGNEIYEYLEDHFETCDGQGWWRLRWIVRAHATCLLCDAIADQLLKLGSLHLLIHHCLNVSAWDEAESFLWSFLPALQPLPTPSNSQADLFDAQRLLFMNIVKGFADRTGRYRFLYDVLEYMISQDLLPLEWLATISMRPIWDRLVRTLSDGDHRTLENAFRFLETVVRSGIGLPDESVFEDGDVDLVSKQIKPSAKQELRLALDTTFSSLFTVLSSIALVNRNREDPIGQAVVQRVTWVLDSIVIGLLKRNDIQADLELLGPMQENMQAFAQRALWVVSASFLVRLGGCCLDAGMRMLDLSILVQAMNWIVLQYSSHNIDFSSILATIPGFISSTARGTGRIWKDDGFDQLQRLVGALLSLSGHRLPHRLWTLKRLALEATSEFAHSTNDVQHAAYARQIERTMHMKGRVVIMHSPQKTDSPSISGGFRWEEGIGEWVACTPFAKQEVKRLPQRPMRPLELLPTPVQSDDDQEGSPTYVEPSEALPDYVTNSLSNWEDTTLFEDTFPQSSPVKRAQLKSNLRSDGRARVSSPMVVIPKKRVQMTPPDSPVRFYPHLSDEQPGNASQDRPRRPRRTRTDFDALISKPRAQRPRSSLNRSLRNIERKRYDESNDIGMDPNSVDSCTDDDASFSPGQDLARALQGLKKAVPDDAGDSEPDISSISLSESRVLRKSPRSSLGKRLRAPGVGSEFEDDRDELGKTPGRVKRRRSGRMRPGRKDEWTSIQPEESEDELSFQ